ncbi:Sporulation protein RMD1 [Astathelohania contejeani]|uniref:Sporulation protein RMD1 n=1 Tax=Astathelohania contejeani TaxID=164912 RepID=A0ABQ7I1X7_9MICR|nr:Sporulation protein RMD1 [Thelohania contejeani]
MKNTNSRDSIQRISIHSTDYEAPIGKKQARIELRALKDALPLTIIKDTQSKENIKFDTKLNRVTAYCTAEKINLKRLSNHLQENSITDKITMYFGECLHASIRFPDQQDSHDIFYYDYGVVVFWGLEENQEGYVLKSIRSFEENKYDINKVEVESFRYGIVEENPMVINDIIYLNSEDHFNKMVISNAIAQSVKLDYFENLVENTIASVRSLPEEVENEGKVGKNRKEILKLVGKLHKLRFNLNLISNILDEPEVLWHYPNFSTLYESFKHYLEIKGRADVLNQRCDIIHGILAILSENINTRNSESLEKTIISLIFCSVVIGIIQILILYFRVGGK